MHNAADVWSLWCSRWRKSGSYFASLKPTAMRLSVQDTRYGNIIFFILNNGPYKSYTINVIMHGICDLVFIRAFKINWNYVEIIRGHPTLKKMRRIWESTRQPILCRREVFWRWCTFIKYIWSFVFIITYCIL